MPDDPTLRDVHQDLVSRLNQEDRLRAVEQHIAALRLLPGELQRMEARLVAAIDGNRPKSPWPAVSAVVALVALALALAAAIYQR